MDAVTLLAYSIGFFGPLLCLSLFCHYVEREVKKRFTAEEYRLWKYLRSNDYV